MSTSPYMYELLSLSKSLVRILTQPSLVEAFSFMLYMTWLADAVFNLDNVTSPTIEFAYFMWAKEGSDCAGGINEFGTLALHVFHNVKYSIVPASYAGPDMLDVGGGESFTFQVRQGGATDGYRAFYGTMSEPKQYQCGGDWAPTATEVRQGLLLLLLLLLLL